MGYFKDLNMERYLADVNIGLPCPLIGIDDGYNQVNLAYWVVKDGKRYIEEAKILSRGKRGRHIRDAQGGGLGIYCSGDEVYTISENLPDPEDTRTNDYAKTPLNRFLVHAGLNKIGITDDSTVAIVTGLPVKQYMRNTKLLEAKRVNMLRPVTYGMSNKRSAKVVYHGAFPEAVAGLADYLMDDYGNPREGYDLNIVRMVLDIGGNTTDMAMILPGNEVGAFETAKFGVSHMRDTLRVILEDEMEIALDSLSLDEALHTRKITIFGEVHDIPTQWERAVSDVLRDIFHAAESFREKFPSMREMVCLGGGAALCEDVIREKFPKVRIGDNPDGANARGYLKYATFDGIDEVLDQIKQHLVKLLEKLD